MATIPLIDPTEDAVATEVPYDSSVNSYILIAADALATTETAPIFILVGATYVPVTDMEGNVMTLTADVPAIQFSGGPVYAVTKDATAGACGVYAITGSRRV